jgi:hypothetical protein
MGRIRFAREPRSRISLWNRAELGNIHVEMDLVTYSITLTSKLRLNKCDMSRLRAGKLPFHDETR